MQTITCGHYPKKIKYKMKQLPEANMPETIAQDRATNTFSDIVINKLHPNQIALYEQQIKEDYPEIYEAYPNSELIALIMLDINYDFVYGLEGIKHENYENEVNAIDYSSELYPQIMERCPDIKDDLRRKHAALVEKNSEINSVYSSIIKAQLSILTDFFDENLTRLNLLRRCNATTRAEELSDPLLKSKKEVEKKKILALNIEIRKLISGNKDLITTFHVKEQIEAYSDLKFIRYSNQGYYMIAQKEGIKVIIAYMVQVFIDGNEEINLGSIYQFDIGMFFERIPKRFWCATHREKQIDSIFED